MNGNNFKVILMTIYLNFASSRFLVPLPPIKTRVALKFTITLSYSLRFAPTFEKIKISTLLIFLSTSMIYEHRFHERPLNWLEHLFSNYPKTISSQHMRRLTQCQLIHRRPTYYVRRGGRVDCRGEPYAPSVGCKAHKGLTLGQLCALWARLSPTDPPPTHPSHVKYLRNALWCVRCMLRPAYSTRK